MMLSRSGFFRKVYPAIMLACIGLLAAACQPAAPLAPEIGDNVGAITITREAGLVERGNALADLQPVDGSSPLFVGETLRTSAGGEGLLDIDNKMVVRLFNDTLLGVKSTDTSASPVTIRFALEKGGLTGRFNDAGIQAVFELPGGATITVSDAQFFVVYDSSQQKSVIGNYSGLVQLGGSIGSLDLEPGSFVDWVSGQMPGQPAPISDPIGQFEQWAREARSANAAVERLQPAALADTDTPALSLSPTATFLSPTPTQPVEPATATATREPTETSTPTITRMLPTRTRTPTPKPTRDRDNASTPTNTEPSPPTNTPPTPPTNTPPTPPTNTPPTPPTDTPLPPPTETQCPDYGCVNPFSTRSSAAGASGLLVIGWLFFGLGLGWIAMRLDFSNPRSRHGRKG